MTFATIVDRVRDDFLAVPALAVTLPQAVRLWNLGADDCRYVLDALVDAGFLRWTPERTIVRADLRPGRPEEGRRLDEDLAAVPVAARARRRGV